MSHRQLTARLEELTEERSLQGLTPHPSSLLCEIEQSMEQEEQEQEREQVRRWCLLVTEAFCPYSHFALFSATSPAMGGLLRGPLALFSPERKRCHGLCAVHRLLHGRVLRDVLSQGCAYWEPPHQPAGAPEVNPEPAGRQRVHSTEQLRSGLPVRVHGVLKNVLCVKRARDAVMRKLWRSR